MCSLYIDSCFIHYLTPREHRIGPYVRNVPVRTYVPWEHLYISCLADAKR